jgi:hypothetical protein
MGLVVKVFATCFGSVSINISELLMGYGQVSKSTNFIIA